jgi:hypothetical protein
MSKPGLHSGSCIRACRWALACLSVFLSCQVAATDVGAPVPLLRSGQPVDWWFVFKFNAKSFPGCGGTAVVACPYGGTPSGKTLSQQFVYASSDDHGLKKGNGCVGDTGTDPVGATFGEIYNGAYHYVVWNDQFYQDPQIHGCGNACSAPWGHSKGVLAWTDSGEGLVMQVTTPSWPAAGSKDASRKSDGNTLGCVTSTDNVLVSQNFFSLRLSSDDVEQVLKGMINASVVTDPGNPQLVNNGGPQAVQGLVNSLGKKSASTQILRVQLSSGVGLLSKPSALQVPPWQLVSAELGGVPLRVASWWTHPAIASTTAATTVECWDTGLSKPGAVEIALSGIWNGTAFGLKGGGGPDFNHAKVGVSSDVDHHFVIFGDMNQQGALADDCGSSQNGRGGLFFILEDEALSHNVSGLIQGRSAPVDGAGD